MDVQNIDEIVTLPFASRVIVKGIPGTGKTECAIQRIKYLIEEYDVDTSRDLLVLSFTRNAVREVKQRIYKKLREDYKEKIQGINVLTFDKFAWRLLTRTHLIGWAHAQSYEGNIRNASRLLRDGLIKKNNQITHNLNQWPELEDLRCLILDEVQDVNTYRAEFSYEILKFIYKNHKSESHFMLLGDLNQEIFAYLSRDHEGMMFNSPNEFLNSIKCEFNITEYNLNVSFEENKRYENLDSKVKSVIIQATNLISNGNITRDLFKSQVNDRLPHTKIIRNRNDFINIIKPYEELSEKTALLYRKNKFASATSLLLFQNNIQHHYLTEGSVYPPWMARIFYDLYSVFIERDDDLVITRQDFQEAWNENFEEKTGLTSLRAWVYINYIATGRAQKLDELSFLAVLKNFTSNFDEAKLEEYGYTFSNIVVTNFHKAKGREYDHVFINDYAYPANYDEDLIDEARTIYVGITRPRKSCHLFRYRPRKYRPYSILELKPDLEKRIFTIEESYYTPEDPFSFVGNDYLKAEKRQNYLWNINLIGEPVDLKIYESNEKIGEIKHKGFSVGNISSKFDEKLKQWLRKHYGSAEQILKGAYIVAVYSCPPELSIRKAHMIEQPFKYLKTWISIKILGVLYIE